MRGYIETDKLHFVTPSLRLAKSDLKEIATVAGLAA
jgi:hypothetical protein